MERAHPFSGVVSELTHRRHEFIKLQMQVPEIGPNNVLVGLLALKLEFNEIRQDKLKIICQSLRCFHGFPLLDDDLPMGSDACAGYRRRTFHLP